MVDKKVKNH